VKFEHHKPPSYFTGMLTEAEIKEAIEQYVRKNYPLLPDTTLHIHLERRRSYSMGMAIDGAYEAHLKVYDRIS
jgi:hypothetical protein